MSNKPSLSTLTYVGFEVNAAIDEGHACKFTFTEIYSGIERGTLLQDLANRLPDVFDFSLFPPGSEQEIGLIESLRDVAGGLEGRERRKVGVEKSGLTLLVAFVLEAIQRQNWTPRLASA